VNTAKIAVDLRDAGMAVTVDALGGVDAVMRALAAEVGPATSIMAEALVADWSRADAAVGIAALQSCLAAQQDPLGYEELWNVLFNKPDVLRSIAARLVDEPARRLEHRVGDRAAGLAALALDALCRLCLLTGAPPWKLYSVLEDLPHDLPSHLLIAAVRRAGLIYVHDEAASVRELVRRFLDRMLVNQDLAADARLELARADLVDALAADSQEGVEKLLRSARAGFGEALALDAERVDAELYRLALDAVLGLIDHRPHTELRSCADQIRTLGFLRRAWKAIGTTEWYGDPLVADREWWSLSQAVAGAAEALSEDSWLEPMLVFEQVARALRAATTVRLLPSRGPSDALLLLVTPVLRAPFVASATNRALVGKWVAQLSVEQCEAGASLAKAVEAIHPKDATDQLRAELVREVGEEIADALSSENKLALLRRLDARKNLLSTEKPQVRNAFNAVLRDLKGNQDYVGDVRACFDQILTSTLRFLTDRMNVGLSNPRYAYLKNPHALENALQDDYRQWMVGNGMQGVVDVEVSSIASGRVDVRFLFGTHVIVAEVKRDEDPHREGALLRYLNQAGAYQASDVRLGILLVLDLSDKTRGQMRSVENNVWVTLKPSIAEGDLARHIVVVVIPGNRVLPPSGARA
jgi:hypothetical protein